MPCAGFVMFMWFLALLAAAAAVAGLAMAAGVRLRRRLHAALEARRRVVSSTVWFGCSMCAGAYT